MDDRQELWLSKTRMFTKKRKNYSGRQKPIEDCFAKHGYDAEAIKGLKDFFYQYRQGARYSHDNHAPDSIAVLFHQQGIRTPKDFFVCHVCGENYTYWDEHGCE